MLDDDQTPAPATDTPAQTTEAPKADAGSSTVPASDGTILDNAADPKPAPSDFPADWREKMAGGDADELKALQRYKSPVEVNKARIAAVKKISSGEVKTKLAADATPEQVSAWRKDNGIPEKAEDYLATLPKGLVIGDADKPLIDGFLARVHGKNADPAVVAEAVGWYYEQQEQMAADIAKADKAHETAGVDLLRDEWGPEYRANINSVKAFFDTAGTTEDGTALSELLIHARLPNGKKLMNEPAALRWMARLANEANPAGFVSPNDGATQLESVEKELEGLRAKMRTPAWAADAKGQARFQQLITAQEKLKK